MSLTKILKNREVIKVYNHKKKINFKSISSNSKLIKKNSIFVIDTKRKIKRNYIDEAINNGANAILSNSHLKNIKIPQFVVKNINKSLLKILNKLYFTAPNNILAITGTNGKSSVLWIVSEILFNCKKKVKSVGTLGFYKNLKKICETNLTTPEIEDLYKFAFSSSKNNNFDFVFEASSHGIAKKRINGLPINIAAITNITHDHLDFHKTINNYRNTKFKLFSKYLSKNGKAIINDKIIKIKNLKILLLKKNIEIISYGKKSSDIFCEIYKKEKIKIKIYKNKYLINFKVFSKFEIENLSCAISCCLSLGLSEKKIINSISKIKKPNGRMELVNILYNGSKIFIDYAHTPDALKNILTKNIFVKKPDLVFGCGGDRDKAKRKIMGKIASKHANKIYITDDNPRNENPESIRNEIYKNCKRALIIASRAQAIKKSIENLDPNSILIIAGKGHEKKQIFSNKKINFDDYQVAQSCIREINNGKK